MMNKIESVFSVENNSLFALLAIFVFIFVFSVKASFSEGTLVKRYSNESESISRLLANPFILTPIEELEEGDYVCCYDYTDTLVRAEVLAILKRKVDYFIRIWLENDFIEVSPTQRFFCIDEKKWFETKDFSYRKTYWKHAKDITTADILMKCNSGIETPLHVEHIYERAVMYDLVIFNHLNFFVSEDEILVHNGLFR